jgi:hypothetical protein
MTNNGGTEICGTDPWVFFGKAVAHNHCLVSAKQQGLEL